MKLVLDSNITTTRNIILSDVFELHAPEYIFSEITKHKELMLRKSKMNEEDFDALLLLLQKHIQLMPKEKYNEQVALAEDILRDIDVTDSPFLAIALALVAIPVGALMTVALLDIHVPELMPYELAVQERFFSPTDPRLIKNLEYMINYYKSKRMYAEAWAYKEKVIKATEKPLPDNNGGLSPPSAD